MGEIVLMAVENPSYHLPDHYLCSRLVQMLDSGDVLKEIPSFEEFHYDYDFHIFHSKAFVHLNNVLVPERFEDFSLDKDGVDVAHRADVFCLDDLYGEFFFGLLVLCEVYFSEAPFPQ